MIELLENLLHDLREDSVPQLFHYVTIFISAMSQMSAKCSTGFRCSTSDNFFRRSANLQRHLRTFEELERNI